MAMYFVYEWLKQEVCALFQAILVAKFNSFDRYTNQKRRRRRFFSQQKKKKKRTNENADNHNGCYGKNSNVPILLESSNG